MSETKDNRNTQLKALMNNNGRKILCNELKEMVEGYDAVLNRRGLSEEKMLNNTLNEKVRNQYDLTALIRNKIEEIIELPKTLISQSENAIQKDMSSEL